MSLPLSLKMLPICLVAFALFVQCQPTVPLERKQSLLRQTAVGPSNQFLVTPRWSPDGQRLLASGYHGKGLFVVDRKTSVVREWLPNFVGRARWRGDHAIELFVFSSANQATSPHTLLDLKTGQVRDSKPTLRQWVSPEDHLLYEQLWERDGRKISYQWFQQLLQIKVGDEVLMKQQGVWGVSVSPDGRMVAFSTGLLARGQLHVHDGKTIHDLGAGIHPTWSPDGRWLIYSRPKASDNETSASDLRKGQLELIGADLYAVQLPEKRFVPLTETPHQFELEPAVSPDGNHIACADWKSGRLLLLPFGIGGKR